MKHLVLFAASFPYGTKEPYLETEVKFYDAFDKITIFSLNVKKEDAVKKRETGNNVTVIPVYYAPIAYIFNACSAIADPLFYRELKKLIQTKRLTFGSFVYLLAYFSRAHYECRQILRQTAKHDFDDALFYAYRFEYQPYVALLLKKKLSLKTKIIARAHGYDLYENRNRFNYIPLREVLLNETEYVFPCSAHGEKYLRELYPGYRDKIQTQLLGTEDHGVQQFEYSDGLRIVSCSNLVPVKRVELFVEALSKIRDFKIEWVHYGSGPLMDSIKALADTILPPNIKACFKGNVENAQLMDEYSRESYFLFVNVSESEGIPVSIMEAMSFGIPCIATDVGGTREIVEEGSGGVLLPKDFETEQLAAEIIRYCSMQDVDYRKSRQAARETWNRKFNAAKNYMLFCRKIMAIS